MKILRSLTHVKIFLSILFVSAVLSCSKNDDEETYTPDFTFSEDANDANKIVFSNTSTGAYLFMQWNFGNGEVSEKERANTKNYTVFYSEKGDYNVKLTLWGLDNELSNNKSASKTVTIVNDVFVADFTYSINSAKPNFVTLNNTTKGDYDRISWTYNHNEITGDNIDETEIYLSKAGNYDVELHVYKDDFEKVLLKQISIAQDDPDYLNNMTLVWSDEFDGTSVNTDYWTFETGAGGWGNNELQNYTNGDNAEVTDGKLIITAKKVNDDKVAGSYTSTRLISKGKKEFTYGRYEIRAKLPSGTGIWPAIWMLGSNLNTAGWPACGEIDIMEYVGYQPDVVHATVHTTAGSGSNGDGRSVTLTTAEEEFHIYGLLWDETEMVFYIDTPDNVTHTYAPSTKTASNWPFNEDQFFILNVAVGGNWGGAQGIDNAIFPQSMEIDYVRVYQ
ncbi:family 16 glycosylhydrolase [Labilibaculum euxinus]